MCSCNIDIIYVVHFFVLLILFFFFFFFNDPATTEIYTLSLHDALPIYAKGALTYTDIAGDPVLYGNLPPAISRSEERFSRNAETDLVCRLLLEKKKRNKHRGKRILLEFVVNHHNEIRTTKTSISAHCTA